VRFGVGRRPDPIVDITPMIDIVFQLVLFFMVSTTFKSAPGIQVDLPRSSQDVVVADKDDLNIWMTLDGAIFVDDQPVDVARLKTILERTAERNPETLVVIKADTGVEHGRVVTVMDMARLRGLSRLAIATEAGSAEERLGTP
jgi:biopolymer transport protein ExbD